MLAPSSGHHPRRLLTCLLLAALASPVFAQSTTVTLKAVDTDGINPAGTNWNDNRLRAYWNTSTGTLDGFMKFDVSSIPDGSNIHSLTLKTYHEYGFGNPSSNPVVRLYRVANDTWSRQTTDPHPGLNEVLTPLHSGFPSADLVPWTWKINVLAANWQTDLTDNTLSLAMRNETGAYSYVYWYGSDAVPAPPELIVTYDTCPGYFQAYGTGCAGTAGVTPSLGGTGCPTPGGGTVSIDLKNAVPNSTAYMLFGLGMGVAPINFACSIEILPALPAPVFVLPMGPAGAITLAGVIPGTVIGPVDVYLQAFFLDAGAPSGVSVSNPLKLHVQ